MIAQEVTIQLTGTVKGELILDKEEAVPVIYSVADIRKTTQKTGTTTRTVKIADTKENHTLLGLIFDVNTVQTTFNVNHEEPCILKQNGVPVIPSAVLQLTRVVKVQHNANNEQSIYYEGVVKDQAADFFTKIGNAELTDIDLSELNHPYTADMVVTSFQNEVTDGFKYLMPLTAGNTFNLNDFRVGIFAKRYFDRIFSNAGFSYEWEELADENTRFDKWVIPYNGDVPILRKEVADGYRVEANKTTEQDGTGIAVTGSPAPIAPFQITIPTEALDPSNSYNPTTSVYTSPLYYLGGGSISFGLVVDWELVLVNDSGGEAFCTTAPTDGNGIRYIPSVYLGKNASLTSGGTASLYSGGFIPNQVKVIAGTEIPVGETVIASEVSTINFSAGLSASGDTYKIAGGVNTLALTGKWRDDDATTGNEVQIDTILRIKSVSMVVQPSMSEIGYLSTVYVNDFIPKKVKQSEFIKSIFTMCNLFVSVDKFDAKKLILKSRDKFYNDGKKVDWSSKLDRSQDQEITFLSSVSEKKTILTYKEDKDAPNVNYQDITGEIYGQLEYTYESEHVKGVDVQEVVFSPTPVTVNDFGAVVPMIAAVAPKINIRVLLDGGERSCTPYTIVNYVNGSGVAVGITVDTYPLLSHFDEPYNPNFDLNFGLCDYHYYQIGAKTNNNLFNTKWRRTLNQINKGLMYVGEFALNELDVSTMELSDNICIDNAWYWINRVEYNANNKSTTKVELMSADDYLLMPDFPDAPVIGISGNDPADEAVSDVINSGYSNVSDYTSTIQFSGNNNIASGSISGAVYGSGNNIQASNVVVIGDGLTALKSGLTSENLEVTQDTNLSNLPTINGGTLASALGLDRGLLTVDINHGSNKEMYAPLTFMILGVTRISGVGNLVITVDSEEKEEGGTVNIGDLMEFSTDHSHGVFNVEIYAQNAPKYYIK